MGKPWFIDRYCSPLSMITISLCLSWSWFRHKFFYVDLVSLVYWKSKSSKAIWRDRHSSTYIHIEYICAHISFIMLLVVASLHWVLLYKLGNSITISINIWQLPLSVYHRIFVDSLGQNKAFSLEVLLILHTIGSRKLNYCDWPFQKKENLQWYRRHSLALLV